MQKKITSIPIQPRGKSCCKSACEAPSGIFTTEKIVEVPKSREKSRSIVRLCEVETTSGALKFERVR